MKFYKDLIRAYLPSILGGSALDVCVESPFPFKKGFLFSDGDPNTFRPATDRLAETDLDMNCPEGSAPLLVGGDSAGGGTAVSLILVLKQGAGWTPQGG